MERHFPKLFFAREIMDETFASLSFRLFHRFLFSSPSSSPRLTVSYISLSPFFSHMQDSLLALLIVDVLFLFVYPTPCPSSPLSLFLSLFPSSFILSLSLSRRRPVEKDGTYGIPRAKSCHEAFFVRGTQPSLHLPVFSLPSSQTSKRLTSCDPPVPLK